MDPLGTHGRHMARAKLTDKTIAHLKPPKYGRAEIWDMTLPGFGVRVTDKGDEFLLHDVRVGPAGLRTQRRMTLGPMPM